jgi:cellulose synthase/poly-beta-1,6-N-acetylglucosamine synthase-like glycosyltransferase
MQLQTFAEYSVSDWFLIIYILAAGIQLVYYWILYGRFAFSKPGTPGGSEIPVSVVLSAKNEYPGLKKNLPLILEQDYPKFEVVVVNDASDDETIFLLEDLSRQYSHLKIVTITQDLNFFKGKKFPLALGIKSASYDHLLLTDADCTPAGNQWIRLMASGFSEDKEIVLGYGKYTEKSGFLNRIIRYETAFSALQYFSLALWGSPYMGVGRNLAYRKKLFIENRGFISHYNVSSGDDDLFINKVANKKNTVIQYLPESYTLSAPKNTFREWWIQKKRHLTTGKYYKLKHKIILGGYSVSYWLFMLLFMLVVLLKIAPLIAFIIFIIRILSQYVILYSTHKKLLEKKLLLISPVIELIIAVLYPVMFGSNLVYKERKWK